MTTDNKGDWDIKDWYSVSECLQTLIDERGKNFTVARFRISKGAMAKMIKAGVIGLVALENRYMPMFMGSEVIPLT